MKNKKLNLLESRTEEWNSTNYQGRRKNQYEDSSKIMAMSTFGLLVVIVGIIIYGIVS